VTVGDAGTAVGAGATGGAAFIVGNRKSPNDKGGTASIQLRSVIQPEEVLREMPAEVQIVRVKGYPPIGCGREIYFGRPGNEVDCWAQRFVRTP
jgi:hypothetical protein